MEQIITKLKTEPVRLRLYALAVLVATYLMAKGHLDPTDTEFIVGVVGTVLAVERSRKKVSPTVYEPQHRA